MDERVRNAVCESVFKIIHEEDCIIFLFGSYVTGEQTGFSDIDIGILGRLPIPAKDFLAIQEKLKDTMPTLRKIDLVDFNSISEKVKKEALQGTQIWHIGKNCRELLKFLKPPHKN
ncbi:MAG: nucleotidyltransferase domain-containing protein [Deltaproteobacteria bacterium]|nr:nucleotidyltransferase domain-containing protein [Deltaproteobacteria bacterium]MDZ4224872.1 nucleotidyltransferase domain-containing protein [bacterium]